MHGGNKKIEPERDNKEEKVMNTESTYMFASCTYGHAMIGAEYVSGIMPCPECHRLMDVRVKKGKVIVKPVTDAEKISPIFMKYWTKGKTVVINDNATA